VQSTKSRTKRKTPEVVFTGGDPTAVISDIEEYQEMLERHFKKKEAFYGSL
jgi:organic radical activating enzyme